MRHKDLFFVAGVSFLSATIGGTLAFRLTGHDAYAKPLSAQGNNTAYSSQNVVTSKDSKAWLNGTKGWTQTGNYIYPVAVDTDSVGIGLISPLYPLDVNGNVNLRAKLYLNGLATASKYLKTDVSGNPIWGDETGNGTVTSIGPGTTGTQTGASQLTFSANPITGTGTIALSNTSVSPGSYTNANLTVDQQGRITSASNGSLISSNAVYVYTYRSRGPTTCYSPSSGWPGSDIGNSSTTVNIPKAGTAVIYWSLTGGRDNGGQGCNCSGTWFVFRPNIGGNAPNDDNNAVNEDTQVRHMCYSGSWSCSVSAGSQIVKLQIHGNGTNPCFYQDGNDYINWTLMVFY